MIKSNSTPRISITDARNYTRQALRRITEPIALTYHEQIIAYFIPIEFLDRRIGQHPKETVALPMTEVRDVYYSAVEDTPIILITFRKRATIYLIREDKYRQLFLRR
jgi:antitoxin (DNA-binding transcriptional repressor) of toxin-antitoxin stability system